MSELSEISSITEKLSHLTLSLSHDDVDDGVNQIIDDEASNPDDDSATHQVFFFL